MQIELDFRKLIFLKLKLFELVHSLLQDYQRSIYSDCFILGPPVSHSQQTNQFLWMPLRTTLPTIALHSSSHSACRSREWPLRTLAATRESRKRHHYISEITPLGARRKPNRMAFDKNARNVSTFEMDMEVFRLLLWYEFFWKKFCYELLIQELQL